MSIFSFCSSPRYLAILNDSFPVKGVLDNAGFPAVVTAHFVPMEGQQRPRTTILIKFADEVSHMFALLNIYEKLKSFISEKL